MALAATTIVLLVRLSIFIAYLLAGAAIFQVLEKENYETELRRTTELRDSIVKKYNISRQDVEMWSLSFRPNPLVKELSLEWNFGNAFIFAMVTVTTVGYGNIVPTTFGGRLFCIFYALFGIPGTCLTLKSIGDKITEIIHSLTATIEKRLLKRTRPKKLELKTAVMTILLTSIVVLPCCAGIVFVREPEWTYFNCFYFSFTTLTTIGYGDFLPHFDNSFDFLLIIVAFIGLAFVSSILCSLNTLMETYGLSARILKSVKTDPENSGSSADSDESETLATERGKKKSQQNGSSRKRDQSESDQLEANDNATALKTFDGEKRGRSGKRESVSVGILQA